MREGVIRDHDRNTIGFRKEGDDGKQKQVKERKTPTSQNTNTRILTSSLYPYTASL